MRHRSVSSASRSACSRCKAQSAARLSWNWYGRKAFHAKTAWVRPMAAVTPSKAAAVFSAASRNVCDVSCTMPSMNPRGSRPSSSDGIERRQCTTVQRFMRMTEGMPPPPPAMASATTSSCRSSSCAKTESADMRRLRCVGIADSRRAVSSNERLCAGGCPASGLWDMLLLRGLMTPPPSPDICDVAALLRFLWLAPPGFSRKIPVGCLEEPAAIGVLCDDENGNT
mmetsp:Transcript_9601/g.29692  ORF Transcript_9601/g.29692 Transcript_9601/m.29692 type:complete len:226 (-) Transcript_9601:504-1181(-)